MLHQLWINRNSAREGRLSGYGDCSDLAKAWLFNYCYVATLMK
jgi:hypothetical protein